MKKRYFLGLPVLILVLVFVLAGCSNDTSEPETWSVIESLDQLDGTWKGSYSQTLSIEDYFDDEEEEDEDEDDFDIAELFGDMKVTISATVTTTIIASDKTQSIDTIATATFSGGNIEVGWAFIKAFIGSEDGVTVNDANHSITMTEKQDPEPLSDGYISEMLRQGIQINQNGTKIILPKGLIDEDIPELTFFKQ